LLAASFLGALSWHQDFTKSYQNDYAGFATTKVVLPNVANSQGDRIDTGTENRGVAVRQFRALGPVSDPNFYSQIMVAVLPFALVLTFSDRSKRVRVIAAAACVPIMAGIVLSFSRGAGIAVILIGICLFFLRYFKLRYALLFAVALVAVIVSSPAYLNRIGSIRGLSSTGADVSLKERSGILRTGVKVFLQHPLLGVGAGRSSQYIEISGIGSSAGVRGVATHNTYLELLVETGILGFSCFMAIVFVTVRNLLRASRYWITRRPEYAHMCAAFMLAILAFLTTSLFLHLAFPRYYWLLMGLSGAAAAIFNPEEAEPEQRANSVSPLGTRSAQDTTTMDWR
jgi:O-antigen ligase